MASYKDILKCLSAGKQNRKWVESIFQRLDEARLSKNFNNYVFWRSLWGWEGLSDEDYANLARACNEELFTQYVKQAGVGRS